MTWRMRIVHTTSYFYGAQVTQSYNEVRLTPRTDTRQNIILSRVETDPATRSFHYRDYWGTEVTSFDLHAPHTALEVVSSTVAETDPEPRPERLCSWTDLKSSEVIERFVEPLENTNYVRPIASLALAASTIAKDCQTPIEAVEGVCGYVHDNMDYVPGSTMVQTTGEDAWNSRKGVCQDYAHIALAMLRSLGIPAKYVSGYLHPVADAVVGQTVAGESHAWIEAWVGEWWGFDPTNNKALSEQHVSVGRGRDYADVTPFKGIYTGGGATGFEVVVEVTRLA